MLKLIRKDMTGVEFEKLRIVKTQSDYHRGNSQVQIPLCSVQPCVFLPKKRPWQKDLFSLLRCKSKLMRRRLGWIKLITYVPNF